MSLLKDGSVLLDKILIMLFGNITTYVILAYTVLVYKIN